jgi:hypothetical protein
MPLTSSDSWTRTCGPPPDLRERVRHDVQMKRWRQALQRQGHRTTLTVPHSVFHTADRLAQELGTTTNDAIILLAQEGAIARARCARTHTLASQRRAMVESVTVDDAPTFPSPNELREAMLAGRRDA